VTRGGSFFMEPFDMRVYARQSAWPSLQAHRMIGVPRGAGTIAMLCTAELRSAVGKLKRAATNAHESCVYGMALLRVPSQIQCQREVRVVFDWGHLDRPRSMTQLTERARRRLSASLA